MPDNQAPGKGRQVMSFWTADIRWDLNGEQFDRGYTSLAPNQKVAWQRVQDTVSLMSGRDAKAVIRDFTTTGSGFQVTILAGGERFDCTVREHEGKL